MAVAPKFAGHIYGEPAAPAHSLEICNTSYKLLGTHSC